MARNGVRRGSPVLYASGPVEVHRDPNRSTGRLLVVDGMEASYVDLAEPRYLEFSYVRRLRDLVHASWPGSAALRTLHVGGGAATFPRYLLAAYRHATCVVWEVDPQVEQVARRYLGLRTHPRLDVRIGDARGGIATQPPRSAHLVVGDAFVDGLPPPHLVTLEATRAVREVLREDGIYALNVVDTGELRRARRLAATLLATFPQMALAAPRRLLGGRGTGNVVLFASAASLPVGRLERRAVRDPEQGQVLAPDDARWFASGAHVLRDEPPAAAQA